MNVWTPPASWRYGKKAWGLFLRNQVLSRRLERVLFDLKSMTKSHDEYIEMNRKNLSSALLVAGQQYGQE